MWKICVTHIELSQLNKAHAGLHSARVRLTSAWQRARSHREYFAAALVCCDSFICASFPIVSESSESENHNTTFLRLSVSSENLYRIVIKSFPIWEIPALQILNFPNISRAISILLLTTNHPLLAQRNALNIFPARCVCVCVGIRLIEFRRSDHSEYVQCKRYGMIKGNFFYDSIINRPN